MSDKISLSIKNATAHAHARTKPSPSLSGLGWVLHCRFQRQGRSRTFNAVRVRGPTRTARPGRTKVSSFNCALQLMQHACVHRKTASSRKSLFTRIVTVRAYTHAHTHITDRCPPLQTVSRTAAHWHLSACACYIGFRGHTPSCDTFGNCILEHVSLDVRIVIENVVMVCPILGCTLNLDRVRTM